MTIFEYFMILISVVLSLTLAQLATGVGELVRSRSAVRWSFAYMIWLAVGLAVIIDLWTSLWLIRDVDRWSLVTILFLLALTLMIYLFVLWLLPRSIGDEPIDLGHHMIANRRLFLTALMAYYVAGAIVNVSVLPPGQIGDLANYVFLPVAFVLTGLAWWTPNRWVQSIVPLLVLAIPLSYFAIYFQTIG